MAGFVDAVQELYQAPVTAFVAERKRLADELKASGDASGAKKLLARKRPTISAWVINQLYWHARDAFDQLLATADKLRQGDLKASAAHREVIARLRQRAATLLQDAGHAPTEATLRRVSTTLSAIAVANGFDPDPPGALAEDRDPPGFAAFGLPSGGDTDEVVAPAPTAPAKTAKATKHKDEAKQAEQAEQTEQTEEETEEEAEEADDDAAAEKETAAERKAREKAEKERVREEREAEKEREADAARQRAADIAEKKREEAEKKRITAERHRLETALRAAKAELHDREREVKQLEKQLEKAQKSVEDAREIVDDLARKLDDLKAE